VPVKRIRKLMNRMAVHDHKRYTQAAECLSSGKMPDVLYCGSHNVNPAIVCLLHATKENTSSKIIYLPAPASNSTPFEAHEPTAVSDVGEVWWLFDADQPYLAELFEDGKVPASRLPHLDRTRVAGKHVARVLGGERTQIKLIEKKAAMVVYTPWCGPAVLENSMLCGSAIII
jgi:hypothetical protein